MDWYSLVWLLVFFLIAISTLVYGNMLASTRQRIKEIYGKEFGYFDEVFLGTWRWRYVGFVRLDEGKYAIVDLGKKIAVNSAATNYGKPYEFTAGQIETVKAHIGFMGNYKLLVQLKTGITLSINFKDFISGTDSGRWRQVAARGRVGYSEMDRLRNTYLKYLIRLANLIKRDCGLPQINQSKEFVRLKRKAFFAVARGTIGTLLMIISALILYSYLQGQPL